MDAAELLSLMYVRAEFGLGAWSLAESCLLLGLLALRLLDLFGSQYAVRLRNERSNNLVVIDLVHFHLI